MSLLDHCWHLGRARGTTVDEVLMVIGYATLTTPDLILKAV
jgi:hypothetical protein